MAAMPRVTHDDSAQAAAVGDHRLRQRVWGGLSAGATGRACVGRSAGPIPAAARGHGGLREARVSECTTWVAVVVHVEHQCASCLLERRRCFFIMPAHAHSLMGASPSRKSRAIPSALPSLHEVGRETSVDGEPAELPLMALFESLRDLGTAEPELAAVMERSELLRMVAQRRSSADGRAAEDTVVRTLLSGGTAKAKAKAKPCRSPPKAAAQAKAPDATTPEGASPGVKKKKKKSGAATDNLQPLTPASASPTKSPPKPKRASTEPVGAGLTNTSGSPLYPSLRLLWPAVGVGGWLQWMVKFAVTNMNFALKMRNFVLNHGVLYQKRGILY